MGPQAGRNPSVKCTTVLNSGSGQNGRVAAVSEPTGCDTVAIYRHRIKSLPRARPLKLTSNAMRQSSIANVSATGTLKLLRRRAW